MGVKRRHAKHPRRRQAERGGHEGQHFLGQVAILVLHGLKDRDQPGRAAIVPVDDLANLGKLPRARRRRFAGRVGVASILVPPLVLLDEPSPSEMTRALGAIGLDARKGCLGDRPREAGR